MKFNRVFFISIMVLGAAVVSSCKGDSNEPGEEGIFLSKLAQTWNLTGGQVTVDGLDVTKDFSGLTIAFGLDKHYTTTHPVSPIWPTAGTFTLNASANNMYDLTRDDGTEISILALSEKSITFTFQYTHSGARTSSVSGKFQFVMNR